MSAHGEAFRLLLVEDNPSDVFLFKASFSRASDVSCELVTVSFLRDAISVIQEQDIDVVVTDLNLPDSIGLETVKRLVEVAAHLPIIALTGNENPTLLAELIEEGVHCYWSKDRIINDKKLPNAIAQTVHEHSEK